MKKSRGWEEIAMEEGFRVAHLMYDHDVRVALTLHARMGRIFRGKLRKMRHEDGVGEGWRCLC